LLTPWRTTPRAWGTASDDRPPSAPSWVRALDPAADAIAATIPQAQRVTIDQQGHVADPRAINAVLRPFLSG
jgi:hypothetical protein